MSVKLLETNDKPELPANLVKILLKELLSESFSFNRCKHSIFIPLSEMPTERHIFLISHN